VKERSSGTHTHTRTHTHTHTHTHLKAVRIALAVLGVVVGTAVFGRTAVCRTGAAEAQLVRAAVARL
jgi:hypothetical protein